MALAVGLKVTGALGLLGKAKREGVISDVRPFLERALQAGVHYHPELIRRFLDALDDERASRALSAGRRHVRPDPSRG